MTPGTLLDADTARLAASVGVTVRPWFGATDGNETHVVVSAPANALVRLGAYRIAVIATWAPLPDEPPETFTARKAEAMKVELMTMTAWAAAAIARVEL